MKNTQALILIVARHRAVTKGLGNGKTLYEESAGLAATPLRDVHTTPDEGTSVVGHHGVAITGKKGNARSAHCGARIAGDSAEAEASNGAAGLAGWHSHASAGGRSVARAGSFGFSSGYLRSMMMVDDGAWAVSVEAGIALARAGLAETFLHGIAAAQTVPSTGPERRGIAIAGPSGIAVAFDEAVVVKAGPGGALVGFCEAGGHAKPVAPGRVVVHTVGRVGHHQVGYRAAQESLHDPCIR